MTKNVVIVGGGTAGWMTASYLAKVFGERVHVTLVESKNVPTVGVGEATFSTVRHFFRRLGLEEHEWMPECHAAYKLAIRFEDWREPGHVFYHPFERPQPVDGFGLADWWQALGSSSGFDADTSVLAALCDAERSPRAMDGQLLGMHAASDDGHEDENQFPYAYHFDATLLARFLARFGVRHGVTHVLDDVNDVALDEQGFVSHVHTQEHGELTGDLFVDCTGFRSVLISKALGTGFVSYQDSLPNDRAVALRVPRDGAVSGMRPCTTATARDAGWIWTIPLFGRIGTGYVYASDYCTPEQAERTLRDFVGPEADGLEANHLRMRIGRSERSWVKNCVAIGLSSGFVEPLESTGIFFIQNAIEQLVAHFPENRDDEAMRSAYNRQVADVMDGVREFLVLHYYAAARTDNDYWRDAKHRPMPDVLRERIESWQANLPGPDSVYERFHGFEPYSYTAMLLGLGGVPLRPRPALAKLDPSGARREFARIARRRDVLVSALPSQYDYLSSLPSRTSSASALAATG